jgi:hypothetical protein
VHVALLLVQVEVVGVEEDNIRFHSAYEEEEKKNPILYYLQLSLDVQKQDQLHDQHLDVVLVAEIMVV